MYTLYFSAVRNVYNKEPEPVVIVDPPSPEPPSPGKAIELMWLYYTPITRPILHESFFPTYEQEPEPSIDLPPPPPGMLLNT